MYFGDAIEWYENTDGAGSFSTARQVSSGIGRPSAIVAEDLDGDGDREVVAASAGINCRLVWYDNTDGAGTFGAEINPTTAGGASSLHAADVNGDGALDVLSAAGGRHKIAWFENLGGEWQFGPERIITAQVDWASSVHGADLDGDGDIDVLSASRDSNTIAWHENTDGAGSFSAPIEIFDTALGAVCAIAADLDGDDDLDVLSASRYDDTIRWFENVDGAGTFQPALTISTQATNATKVVAADLDGDGDLDVVSAKVGGLQCYENTDGMGTFGPPVQILGSGEFVTTEIATADFDGDGNVDLLVGTGGYDWTGTHWMELEWFKNTNNLSFLSVRIERDSNTDGSYNSVSASDVDGDGDRDVVTWGHGNENRSGIVWFENDGLGSFGSRREIRFSWNGGRVLTADFDGEGDQGIIIAFGGSGGIDWYRNDIHEATARFRNAGSNPESYSTSLPVLGRPLTGRVDLEGTTGHNLAWLVGFADPRTLTLGGGQVLLVDFTHPAGELLNLVPLPGPTATFSLDVPSDLAFLGLTLSTQSLQIGGPVPFALSNAFDLTLDL